MGDGDPVIVAGAPNRAHWREDADALGRLAYEAYAGHADWKSLVTGAALPQWPALPEAVRLAWTSAAAAVSNAVLMPDAFG